MARAALEIYRREPIAERVWGFGERLRQGVNALCAEVGVTALTGPPFRMGLSFDEPDPHRLGLKRILYQQELLKSGGITYDGVMLPSVAHDDAVLAVTLAATATRSVVARAGRGGDFDRYLEVPPLWRRGCVPTLRRTPGRPPAPRRARLLLPCAAVALSSPHPRTLLRNCRRLRRAPL
jgi:hypothetical protein